MDDDTREDHRDRLVGFLSLWGLAETALDLCIWVIYREHGGAAVNPDVPVTIERKIRFLRRAIAEIPSLEPWQVFSDPVASLFMAEKDVRNIIVHAAPLKVERNGTAHFVRLRVQPSGEMRFDLRVIGPKEWRRLERVCAELFAHTFTLLVALTKNPGYTGLDKGKDAPGKDQVQFLAGLPMSKSVRKLFEEVLARSPNEELRRLGSL